MSISNVNHSSTWVTCASIFLHDLCLWCPCLVQHTMFRFLSSFSIIFLIPIGKLSCASFQHIASNLTLVMSSLESRLEIAFTLFVDHWYSFWRKRRNTSTEAEINEKQHR